MALLRPASRSIMRPLLVIKSRAAAAGAGPSVSFSVLPSTAQQRRIPPASLPSPPPLRYSPARRVCGNDGRSSRRVGGGAFFSSLSSSGEAAATMATKKTTATNPLATTNLWSSSIRAGRGIGRRSGSCSCSGPQQIRWASRKLKNRRMLKDIVSAKRSADGHASPQVGIDSQGLQMAESLLAPGTMVPLPFLDWPFLQPARLVRYLWMMTKFKLTARISAMMFRIRSRGPDLRISDRGPVKPPRRSMVLGARFFPQKRTILPAAKVLHRRLNEAMAAGDSDALDAVAHRALAKRLRAAITGRHDNSNNNKNNKTTTSTTTTTSWEIVRYNRPLFRPRLVFHSVMALPPTFGTVGVGGKDARYAQQIGIVAIDSTQKLVVWRNSSSSSNNTTADAEPEKVSERIERKREHVVVMRVVDALTYEARPWRIWSFDEPMGPEKLSEMFASMKAMMEMSTT